jgi:hypothetical protein
VNAIAQTQKTASEFVVEADPWREEILDTVEAWRVGNAEREIKSTRTWDGHRIPHALIARDLYHQESWTLRPLVEGRDVDRQVVRSPNELLHLGPRKPTKPVACDRVAVCESGPLVTHYRIVLVLAEHPTARVASCMVQAKVVPQLVEERLPTDSCPKILGPPVPIITRGWVRSAGRERAPRCNDHRVLVAP